MQTLSSSQRYLFLFLGNLLLAIASAWFILPAKIVCGGVNGIAIILEQIFNWNSIYVINTLILIFFILGSLVLGKAFAIRTLISSICYPLFLQLVSIIQISPCPALIASIMGGAFMGIGIGMIIRSGGSSGGMDVPPLILHKYTGISISTWVLICDSCIVLGGFLVYGALTVFIGLLSVLVCAKAMKLIIGNNKQVSSMISNIHQQNTFEKDII